VVSSAIAVTGATGMVGRHAVEAVSRSGRDVKPITRSEWDLCQWADLRKLGTIFGDVGAVIHAGAIVPKDSNSSLEVIIAANVTSCVALCEWALSQQTHIIYISGAIVYSDTADTPHTEETPITADGFGGIYRLSKVAAENVFQHYMGRGLKCTILRATSIFGTGMAPDKMIPRFLNQAQTNKEIELQPPIDNVIDLVHAWDVAQASILALQQETSGVYNIGSESPVQLDKIAEACVQVAGKGRVKILSPGPVVLSPKQRFIVSCERARSRLGFKSTVNLHKGLLLMAAEKLIPNCA